MSLFQQFPTHHFGKSFIIILCITAFLFFYHLHGVPSTTATLITDANANYFSLESLGPTSGQKHPIEILVQNARRKYTRMVQSQSKSLAQAITEYKRRYNREPPPGFDDWYHVAIRLNATIIDEYDSIMTMFEPYWGISARELRTRVREALDPRYIPSNMLGMRVKDHQIEKLREDTVYLHYQFDVLEDRLQPFLQFLPDMEFAYNLYDEPIVLTPHDVLSKAINSCAIAENDIGDPWEISTKSPKKVYFNNLAVQRTWETAIRSCPLDSPSRSTLSTPALQKTSTTRDPEQLLFPQNISHTRNVCELSEAGDSHGIFLTPGDFWHTNTLVPIFSRTKLSSNQDLLMPATDYSSEMTWFYKPYNESQDIPWDQKKNRLYWTGSMSDGKFEDERWRTSQRFRFVRDLNNGSKPITLLRQKYESGSWEYHSSKMEVLSKHIHVKFSGVGRCSEEECNRMQDPEEGLAFAEHEGIEASYGSKFAFDIDGASYTERFQRLLQSHNTVFKMTIFQEWHDDFLVPWVHYVPVTLGMQELPETLRFFVETEKGQEIGKAIAEEGRRWVQQTWRPVDMKLAFFRILLEYARIWGPERDERGECPWDRNS